MAGMVSQFGAALVCACLVMSLGVCGAAKGKYYVVNDAGQECLLFNAVVSFSDVNVSTIATRTSGTIQPTDSLANGTCGELEAEVVLTQVLNTTKVLEASATFHFLRNKTAKTWTVSQVELNVWDHDGVNATLLANLAGAGYTASYNGSYQCNAGSTWTLVNGLVNDGQLMVKNFTAQPFNVNGHNTTSTDIKMCDGDKAPSTSNVVPIAVGAALCGLVLIVLVAYIIGRSRHQKSHKGYQSV